MNNEGENTNEQELQNIVLEEDLGAGGEEGGGEGAPEGETGGEGEEGAPEGEAGAEPEGGLPKPEEIKEGLKKK